MNIRIRGHWQCAVGNGGDFGDIHGCGGQHRQIIGTVDGHGQCVGGSAAMPVGRCDCKGVGQALPYAQALHRGQAVVQGIGIVAVRVQRECAIAARRVGLRGEGRNIMNIRIHRRGQRAADAGRILGNGSRSRSYRGCVIRAVDGHSQSIGGRSAVIVSHHEGEGLCQAFAHAQPLHHRQHIIQRISIVAVGIHAEGAVETRRICLRNETDHIVQIRINRGGQRAADRRRVLGNGRCGSGHRGRVVAAVDAHGDYRGG